MQHVVCLVRHDFFLGTVRRRDQGNKAVAFGYGSALTGLDGALSSPLRPSTMALEDEHWVAELPSC